MVDLGVPSRDGPVSRHGVSGDGKVVVGYQEPRRLHPGRAVGGRPAGIVSGSRRFRRDGERREHRRLDRRRPDLQPGSSRPSDPNFQSAWVWTAQDGTQCLPAPSLRVSPGPLIIVEANATSDDGRVIGGGQSDRRLDRIPTPSSGSIAARLFEGLPAGQRRAGRVRDAGSTRASINGVSPDGRILVGTGAALGGFRGYIVILGRRCHEPPHSLVATLIFLLALPAPARAQSWEASGLAGYTPSAGLDRRAPELNELDIRERVHVGRSGGALVHAALGCGGAVDAAVVGAPARNRGAGARDLFTMTVGQLHGNVVARVRGRRRAGCGPSCSGASARRSSARTISSPRPSCRSGSAAASNTSPGTRSASAALPLQADDAERRRRRPTSATRSASVRAPCSRSSSPAAQSVRF